MPRGDQTGPMGQGPRTGRGIGNCAFDSLRPSSYPVYRRNRRFALSQGCGFGMSGYRFFTGNPANTFQQNTYQQQLEQQKERLTAHLQAIEQELANVQKAK